MTASLPGSCPPSRPTSRVGSSRAGNEPSRSCTLLYFVLGYGCHVENPDEVIKGAKPRLREVGPFIYKAVTIKDSVDFDTGKVNLHYNEDGETLTYRQR